MKAGGGEGRVGGKFGLVFVLLPTKRQQMRVMEEKSHTEPGKIDM